MKAPTRMEVEAARVAWRQAEEKTNVVHGRLMALGLLSSHEDVMAVLADYHQASKAADEAFGTLSKLRMQSIRMTGGLP